MFGKMSINKLFVVFVLFFVLSGIGSALTAGTIMNGKEVTAYIGHIISHNERMGEIVVKTENSTGHWRLSRHVVVFSGHERLPLYAIWRKTQTVQVDVSRDGEVQRITVLEWK